MVGRSLFLLSRHIQGQLLSCTVYLHHLQPWDRACLPVGQGTRSFTLGLNAASMRLPLLGNHKNNVTGGQRLSLRRWRGWRRSPKL